MIIFFTKGFDIAVAEKCDRTSTQTSSFWSSNDFYRHFYNLMSFHKSSYLTANFAEILESMFIVARLNSHKNPYIFSQ